MREELKSLLTSGNIFKPSGKISAEKELIKSLQSEIAFLRNQVISKEKIIEAFILGNYKDKSIPINAPLASDEEWKTISGNYIRKQRNNSCHLELSNRFAPLDNDGESLLVATDNQRNSEKVNKKTVILPRSRKMRIIAILCDSVIKDIIAHGIKKETPC